MDLTLIWGDETRIPCDLTFCNTNSTCPETCMLVKYIPNALMDIHGSTFCVGGHWFNVDLVDMTLNQCYLYIQSGVCCTKPNKI